jgi:tetratricopeptide (TPR) repeat protein
MPENERVLFVHQTAVMLAPKTSGTRFCPRLSRLPASSAFSLFITLCLARGLPGVPREGSAQAQAHAEKGLQLIREGNLEGAEAELRLSVQLDAENTVYLGSLGAVLGMESKLEESDVYLEKALRLDPADWKTRRNLASNQYQLGQLRPAKENLERVLKAAPGDKTTRLLLGMVAEESEDYPAAVKWLAAVPEQVRQRPESIVALARAYSKIGQKENARHAFKDLLALSVRPEWREAVLLGGQAAAQAGDYETAERIFTSISASYPDHARLGYNLALAQYHNSQVSESRSTLERLVAAGHDTGDIENLLGWCAFKQARYKDAVAALDRAIMLDPSRESNYLDVGMMLLELRRYEGAQLAAEKAVELAPASADAYRLKGLVEFRRGSMLDARKFYARAVELNPGDVQAVLGLASAQWNDGKFAEAEETFNKALQVLPSEPLLYQNYGTMLLKVAEQGDAPTETRAVALLRKALGLDSSLAEPHYQLGSLALRKGHKQEATQELETASRLGPMISKFHYTLAQAYRALGRRDDATQELGIYRRLKAEEEKPGAGLLAGSVGSSPVPMRPSRDSKSN